MPQPGHKGSAGHSRRGLHLFVHLFISLLFLIIGASFIATTAALAWEFADTDWLKIANFYSHLFVFFPTLGIVALVAFYWPACVCLDMYMRPHLVRAGRYRFAAGFIVVAVVSWLLAMGLAQSPERSIFEVDPAVLKADTGEPTNCAEAGRCERVPILVGLRNVEQVSQSRVGVSDLVRNCQPDALKDPDPGFAARKRYCFASTPLPASFSAIGEKHRTTDADCCTAQRNFRDGVNRLHAEGGRSDTARLHVLLLPFKMFFFLMVIVISVVLAARQRQLKLHYRPYKTAVERGVLIGAAAIVIYPVMVLAFAQSAALLYPRSEAGTFRAIANLIQIGFVVWAAVVTYFFFRMRNRQMQQLARLGGLGGGLVAVLKYDLIVDMSVRLFGTGSGIINELVAVLALLACIWLVLPFRSRRIKTAQQARALPPGWDRPV